MCAALSGRTAAAQNNTTSISAQNFHKLVNPDDIISGLEDAQSTVRVIVNLFEPNEVKQKTLWKGPALRQALRTKISARVLEAMSAVGEKNFRLKYSYKNFAAFSGEITVDGLNSLLAEPKVKSIELDRIEYMHLAQGIPLMDGMAYRSMYDGSGVAIAVVDTGIDYTHPRLGGGAFPNTKVIGGYDFGDDDSDPMPNAQAHGTCCAGIAAGDLGAYGDYIGGVAPGAKLYALKITHDGEGTAFDSDIIAAWDWCITNQYDDPANPILVISLSFGGGRYYSACDYLTAYANAADRAENAGITIFASSGNDGYCDSIASPACVSNIISVGAVYDADFGTYYPCVNAGSCAIKYSTGGCSTGWYSIDNTAADMVTSYSNAASFLDVFAPSNRAYTTDIAGSGGYSSGDYYSSFGGTSAACPYAAGAVAVLQSASKTVNGDYLSPSDVRDVLTLTGDLITDGKVTITKPRVNLQQAIEALVPAAPQPPVAEDVNVSTPINTLLTIELIGDDEGLPDPPAALDYIVSSLPANGSLSDPNAAAITTVPYTLTGGGNEVIYTPDSNYVGTDTFLYKLNDGGTEPNGGDSNLATVTINIIDAIYTANMDTNPGWTLNADWQWGTPIGGGSHNYDPTSGYTGNNVIGYNLSGDYPNRLRNTRYATTGPIDCRGYENIVLRFYRWLGVESSSYDHANLQVSNNGTTWTDVWVHSGSAISDSSWLYLEYNLPSAVVDNQQTVYLRWGMGTTDFSITYPGWNIDDVELNGDVIAPQQYTLTVSSTTGGSVTAPGEDAFVYDDETVVDINAAADSGYHFVNWTGDTATIADVNSSATTIIVDADYSIQANFTLNPCAPQITSTPETTATVTELYAYDVDADGLPAPTYSLLTSPNDMTIDPNTGLIEWTPAEQDIGPNVPVTVRAENIEGFDQQSFEIDVDGVAPVITSSPITTASADSLYSYDVDANGIPAPTYSLLTSPNDMTIDPNTGLIEWTPDYFDIGQVSPATVEATNSQGSQQQDFEIRVLPGDNFNDKARSAMWRTFEDDYEQVRIVEDQNRLQVFALEADSAASAVYATNGWALNANESFSVQADFLYADAPGWVGLTVEGGQEYIAISAGADGNESYYYYETIVDGNIISEQQPRDGNDGILYIWYDADSNNLYVSHTGPEISDAYLWQTTGNPLQQDWLTPADIVLGGGSTGGLFAGGEAYLDNFKVTAGRLYKWPPVTDLDGDGFIDLGDIAAFTTDWLAEPNVPADFDTDGDVDFTDFAELGLAW